jgi:hypothetical protein
MQLREPYDLPSLIALLFGLWSAFTPRFSTANTLNARRDKVLESKLSPRHRLLILKNDWLQMCRVESVSNIGIVITLTLLAILFQPIPTASPGIEGSLNGGQPVPAQNSDSKQSDAGHNKVQQMNPIPYWICWALAIGGALFKFLSAIRVDLIDYREMRDYLGLQNEKSLKEMARFILPLPLPGPLPLPEHTAKGHDSEAKPAKP